MTDILGEVLAIARGLPPDWVTDIPGCEAWAVLQAAALAQPGGVTFNSDCQPCIEACKGSLKSEASAKKKNARIYNVLLPMLDGVGHDELTWMPAHTTKKTDMGYAQR